MIKFVRLKIRDFKVIAKADLELFDRGLVLVHGINDDTDAADSNGAGKSTIFEALSWCLFGEIIGGSRLADEVIRFGTEKAEVSVDFIVGGHTYTVTRRRTPRTGALTLLTDGASTTGRTLTETESRVRDLLGLDWAAFRNTVLHGQGDRSRFANRETPDTERKAVLKRILRLDRFDDALDATRARRKELAGDAERLRLELRAAQVERTTTTQALERARSAAETWERRRVARLAELRAQTDDEPSAEDLKLVESLPRALELQREVKGREGERELEIVSERRAVQEWDRRADRARSDLAQARKELARAEAELKKFRGSVAAKTCPTCGQGIEDGHVAAALATREADVRRATERAALAEEAIGDLGKRPAEPDISNPWREKAERLRSTIERARVAQSRIEALALAGDRRRGEIEKLSKATDPNLDDIVHYTGRLEELETVEAEKAGALALVDETDRLLAFWADGFSNRGLPSLALDTVVPLISEAANRYLRILSDGDLSVEIATTTELKGGGEKDAISLRFWVEGTPDVQPSGGQWRKFGIAIDLALMDLVATREGAQIDLLLLDEVLDGLDAEGRSRMVTLLRLLRETRSSVFVVSHDPTVAESFERRITVRKTDGASMVEEE